MERLAKLPSGIWPESAFFYLLFVFLLFCSGNAFAQVRHNKDYCKSDGRIVALLIDITTPYDQTDKNVIVRMTDQILSSLKGGEKLVIRTIADSHTRSERLLDRCIPHCSAEGVFDRLFKCSDGVIRSDRESVRTEVVQSLRQRLSKFEELPYSDIVRTIVTVAKEDIPQDRQVSLYIYSDLIENSDYFPSRYLFSYTTKRLIYGLKEHFKLMAPLKNAEVRVSGVGRSGSQDRRPLTVVELKKLTEFWISYFEECGAKPVTIGQDTM